MDGEEDRRRLRADDSAGRSLSDWVGQALNRLSWRTPIHGLRLRGRYPLQLVDVPGDPIPGDARAGAVLLDGRMTHAGETVALDALDRGGFSPAFADYLQGFAWLRDLAAAAPRAQGTEVAEALTRRWLARHGRAVEPGAWRADLWGRRIQFWTAYAPYILDSRDAAYRKEVLNALARGARHLDTAADSAGQGLPRVAAWAGVATAGLLIPGGDIRTAHGEAGIARALAGALHGDGGLISRVPVEQLGLVELLAQLRAVYEVRARPPAGAVTRALSKAVPALLSVTLGEGAEMAGLSSWQGGGPVSRARVQAAVAASGVRPRPLAQARDWGYQRLAQGATRLVMDAAPPPKAALARGGCASTLAFECSDGPQRIVVNCGGGAGLPPALADALRTTAAHSTLTLADTNSTALHADGTLGRGVSEVELTRGDTRIEAAHDGYVRRLGLSHRRRVTLTEDGRLLEGEDRLLPAGRRRGADAVPYAIRFHLAPGIEPDVTADNHGALLRPPVGQAWQFRASAGLVAIEESVWIDPHGRPRATTQLVVTGEVAGAGATIAWTFRRVR